MTQHRPDHAKPKDEGLMCPKCGCRHLPVQYTRQRNGYIMRVRECRYCGRRMTTREQ